LSLQLSELARDRGDPPRGRSAPRRLHPCAAAGTRRRRAPKGQFAHHARRTGRRRRSHAAGNDKTGAKRDPRGGVKSPTINPTANNRAVPPSPSPCPAIFLRYFMACRRATAPAGTRKSWTSIVVI